MSIYDRKKTEAVIVSESSKFTSAADVSVVNKTVYAISTIMDASGLILNNNITIKNTTDDVDTIINDPLVLYATAINLGYEGTSYIIGNNSNKKITASYTVESNSDISANGIYCIYSLCISGKSFLYTINAQAKNSGRGAAEAYGILSSQGDLYVAAKIAKDVTVSATTTASTANAVGFYADSYAEFNEGITGNIKVTASSQKDIARAAGIEADGISIDKIMSGNITVSATGSSENEDVYAYGFLGKGSVDIAEFNSNLNVSAKNNEVCHAFGIYFNSDSYLYIDRSNKGNIKVSATSTDGEANAYGIWGGKAAFFYNFNCSLSVSASSKNDNAWAIGVCLLGEDGFIYFTGDITKDISVSAKNTQATEVYVTKAIGFDGGYFSSDDISAKISVNAQNEGDSYAIAFDIDGDIDVKDITGKISVTAVDKEHYGRGYAYATIFESTGAFTADSISGTLSAVATNGNAFAVGIDAVGISIQDMKKSKLNVTAKSKNSDSTAVGIWSNSGMTMSDADFDFGEIFVSASSKDSYDSFACGIDVAGIMGNYTDHIVSGDITVKSSGSAYGIYAGRIDSTSAINLVVSGTELAVGYAIQSGDLSLTGAKVKAYVTDKANKDNAYAVYAMEDIYSDYNTQDIYITGKSDVTGHVYLGMDYDSIYIESGSKLRGALIGVDSLTLDISEKSKHSLWDAVDHEDITQTSLIIDFDYGMTGDFLLCTKESAINEWTDIFEDYVQINLGGFTSESFDLSQRYNRFSDSFYEFELQADGNKLILSVTDID